MNTALQGSVVDWQTVSVRESAAPPTRVCVLWKLTAPGKLDCMLISTSNAPGSTSATVKRRSENSAEPTSPPRPTWIMGRGLVRSLKFSPEAEIIDQTPPTRRLPGGT